MIPADPSVRSRPRRQRTPGGASLGREASAEAKRLAAAILEVLAGVRTPQQAAAAVGVSLPRYYQVEAGGLRALLTACESKPRGRRPDPHGELAAVRKQVDQLQRDLARQRSLVRLAQRAVGLPPPTPPVKPANGKRRSRKPTARALTAAARLRAEAESPPPAPT
jgi:hypothetical protein